ncbi:type II toxin-antitoxin system VapC family toxin [Natronorubrum tibetense]|uniref:PilT protein domain protein n=1 Tax=Natronorubrum tibetense GA33 TaxID=1114856 RepID=L9VRV3_9EURY|nr:PIN domain-containing protein [Natronorubrum tibetense]ELY39712.1 PilT protein domain protein [Natronorubrum tibetense GA33]
MSGPGTTPLFVDTGAFFAHFVRDSPRHERARTVMNGIQTGDLWFRPLYTTGYVLGELATLILRKKSHEKAFETLRRIRNSSAVTVLHPDETQFDAICDEFAHFDDQQISFVDHATGSLAAAYEVEHVFAFDSDFRTLGFTLVPDDVPIP